VTRARSWYVHRHRQRPRGLGATRTAALGLAAVTLLAAGASVADYMGFYPTTAHADAAWDSPAQVITVVPPAPSPSKPAVPLKIPAGGPTDLRIPAISVTTSLEALGLDQNGQLTPPGYTDAGWYAAGTAPGDIGPAVIAGHYDTATRGGASIFYKLSSVKPGDAIQIKRNAKWLTFIVTSIGSFPQSAFPTELVYGPTPNPQLRLITCGGTYNTSTQTYADNVVVFATESPA
jgi:Sortase domain